MFIRLFLPFLSSCGDFYPQNPVLPIGHGKGEVDNLAHLWMHFPVIHTEFDFIFGWSFAQNVVFHIIHATTSPTAAWWLITTTYILLRHEGIQIVLRFHYSRKERRRKQKTEKPHRDFRRGLPYEIYMMTMCRSENRSELQRRRKKHEPQNISLHGPALTHAALRCRTKKRSW